MSLTKCKDCGQQLSTKATACPGCGAPIKRTSLVTKAFVGILGATAVISVFSVLSLSPEERAEANRPAPAPELSPEEKAKRGRETAVAMGASQLKSLMHDPARFELSQALAMPDGAGCYTFRGANAFGAVRVSHAVAADGVLVTSQDDSGRFNRLWKRHCDGKTGSDVSASARFYSK